MEGSLIPSSSATSEAKEISHAFECHICTELPSDPVTTTCGHVFCWSCMYRWIKNGPKPCPVCRTVFRGGLNVLALGIATRAQIWRPKIPAVCIRRSMKLAPGDQREYTEDYKALAVAVNSALERRNRKRDRITELAKKLNNLRQSNSELVHRRNLVSARMRWFGH